MTNDNQGMDVDNDAARGELADAADLGRKTSGLESKDTALVPEPVSSPPVTPLPSVPGTGEFEATDDGIDDGGWLCI
jgi:hypothetical protein